MATTLWIHPDNTLLSTKKQEGWVVYSSDSGSAESLKRLLPEKVWVNEGKDQVSTQELEGFVELSLESLVVL